MQPHNDTFCLLISPVEIAKPEEKKKKAVPKNVPAENTTAHCIKKK